MADRHPPLPVPDRGGPDLDPPTRPHHTAAPTAGGVAAGAAEHARRGLSRLAAAWQTLSGEYRLAAGAAVGLFLSMLLPWYSATAITSAGARETSFNAFEAFSWIEAAELVVAASVLVLCFARGERRAFHLPGGDGVVIFAGGAWASLLIFIRFIDKPDVRATAVGVTWGIMIAFGFALLMAYAGLRLRAAHRPEPNPRDEAIADRRAPDDRHPTRVMLPDEEPTRAGPADVPVPRRRPPRDGDDEQLTLEE